jgi:hypothetical protein
MNLGLRPNNRNRQGSKSPILGKNSAFGRKKNFGFGKINNNLNDVKKNLIQQKNNVFKKSGLQGSKKINVDSNQKKTTVISGELYQEAPK